MKRPQKYIVAYFCLSLLLLVASCQKTSDTVPTGMLQLIELRAGSAALTAGSPNTGVPSDQAFVGEFSSALDTASVIAGVTLTLNNVAVPVTFSFPNNSKSFSLMPLQPLLGNKAYRLVISNTVKGKLGEIFNGAVFEFTTIATPLTIQGLKIGAQVVSPLTQTVINVPLTGLTLEVNFSAPVDPTTINATTIQILGPPALNATLALSNGNQKLTINVIEPLKGFRRYRLFISDQILGAQGEVASVYVKEFYSAVDPTPVFPVITDDELLTLVQQQTFKYFWDFAHPNSGLARERNTSGDIVTTGGSGFGVMAILVGIQRNFITRSQGVSRLNTIVSFLQTADRFHGAWPHWMNGNTGDVVPFSPDDNGGDLVETSFMLQGLLAARQFLNPLDATENSVIQKINALWEAVEFDWYTKGGENVLYWHWSPTVAWKMNFPVRGYNEALIMYVLAAGSPTHTINAPVYHQGWARSGGIVNGKTFYGHVLPLGSDLGGPLFFAHYSFLGFNPTGLSDTYANYWTQNVNHSLINHDYCVANPSGKIGYSDQCWGLTASDNESGYSAHSPTNDLGVISPTAALSSFPYTPTESMKALKFFYYNLGDRLWGSYGFYDAFNPGKDWYATSYLAIDQGPIIVMIENHRTGLLWNLFMSAPEVQTAMTKLGFSN
ncbi:MAG: Ig-like domain-containing protein [Cyclobacteriaceae bacterium]|nr:Ig-like domain-containing protein [Cyclobacteriaceae bacterium]